MGSLDSLFGFLGDSVDSIVTLVGFLFSFLKWFFFFISSPELLIMGVLIFAFGVALSKADNIFGFLVIVFGVVFPFLKALISVVVMFIDVLIGLVRLLIPSK